MDAEEPNMATEIHDERMDNIIEALQDLLEDGGVPRNVKTKIEAIIAYLKEDADINIRVNKALSELDEIADDSNLQAYTRTQIWNIASLLEML